MAAALPCSRVVTKRQTLSRDEPIRLLVRSFHFHIWLVTLVVTTALERLMPWASPTWVCLWVSVSSMRSAAGASLALSSKL